MSKLPNVGTTIFTVMSKLAVEHNAINLSQGFPNFPVDIGANIGVFGVRVMQKAKSKIGTYPRYGE